MDVLFNRILFIVNRPLETRHKAAAQQRLKSSGDQRLGPNTWALAPRAGQRPSWVLDAGGGHPFPL